MKNLLPLLQLSNFFVAAYALVNFSVFHATVTRQPGVIFKKRKKKTLPNSHNNNNPGWRPSFKYYNEWVSLLGTFLCVFVMFAVDWLTAIVTFVVVIVLYMYIAYAKPGETAIPQKLRFSNIFFYLKIEANWGSSTQGQQFVTALKGVQVIKKNRLCEVKVCKSCCLLY